MKSTKIKTKTEKGITLIALIITIVVLMILAAVAINSITNEGILSQAGSTANKYNQSVLNEQSYLQDYEDMLTAANGGYETYEVGDEITITLGNETHNFYVIEDKTSLGKVVLLAKAHINTSTLKQENANAVAFSATAYWADDFTSDPYDLTETGVPDESHYAARAAYDYGAKLGGKGRLLTYNEVNNDLNAFNYYMAGYWIASAASLENLYFLTGSYNGDEFLGFSLENFKFDMLERWVRPVIEISKSKVTKVQ